MKTLDITPEEALVLKGLIERNENDKVAVYDALKQSSLIAFKSRKLAYEDSCMEIWSFNFRHGIRPNIEVRIPEV